MTPIDRLAAVRQQMRLLAEEHERLRQAVIHGDISPLGVYYTATVRRHVVLRAIPVRDDEPKSEL